MKCKATQYVCFQSSVIGERLDLPYFLAPRPRRATAPYVKKSIALCTLILKLKRPLNIKKKLRLSAGTRLADDELKEIACYKEKKIIR